MGTWPPSPPTPTPLSSFFAAKGSRTTRILQGFWHCIQQGFQMFNNLANTFPHGCPEQGWTGVWRVFLPPQLSGGGCVYLIPVWLADRGAGFSTGVRLEVGGAGPGRGADAGLPPGRSGPGPAPSHGVPAPHPGWHPASWVEMLLSLLTAASAELWLWPRHQAMGSPHLTSFSHWMH